MLKNPLLRSLMSLLTLSIFASCASMEAYEAQYCSQDRAYVKGFDDGSKGMNSRIDEFASCSVNSDLAMKGYREGFEKGTAQLHQSSVSGSLSKPHSSQPSGSGTTINIGIGRGGVNVGGGGGSETKPGYERAWFCEIETFGKNYESWGPTLLEAQRGARAQCERQNHRMHCDDQDDLKCRRNL